MSPAIGRAGVLALLLVLGVEPALARECGEGRVLGGMSTTGDAIQNFDCAMLGRIYCRAAEDRDAGLAQEESVRRSADWLATVNRTGSHTKGNWQPIVAIAATEAYRGKRAPGPTYYRAIYGCGVVKRVGSDAAAQRRAGQAFDAEADRCEKEHALSGRSYPNPALRDCLAAAVDRVTGSAPRAAPKP